MVRSSKARNNRRLINVEEIQQKFCAKIFKASSTVYQGSIGYGGDDIIQRIGKAHTERLKMKLRKEFEELHWPLKL